MTRGFVGRSLPISILVHAAGVSGLILTSVLLPGPFPETLVRSALPTVAFAMEAPPRPADVRATRPAAARPRSTHPSTNATSDGARLARATDVRVLPDGTDASPAGDPVDFDGSPGGGDDRGYVVSGGEMSGTGEGLVGSVVTDPVRVGGDVRPPRQLRHAPPDYPELARLTRTTGHVVLDCLIDEEGRVREVSVLRGHPLLAPAAVAAVERWVYAPTLLNGVPVQVLMTVTVRFELK